MRSSVGAAKPSRRHRQAVSEMVASTQLRVAPASRAPQSPLPGRPRASRRHRRQRASRKVRQGTPTLDRHWSCALRKSRRENNSHLFLPVARHPRRVARIGSVPPQSQHLPTAPRGPDVCARSAQGAGPLPAVLRIAVPVKLRADRAPHEACASTLPGLRMPSGSSARLMARWTRSEPSESCSERNGAL